MILPLSGGLAIHIFMMVLHYILFGSQNAKFIFFDLILLTLLAVLIRLMFVRGPYIPLQQAIKALLPVNGKALLDFPLKF